MRVEPYLYFDGRCEEALEFYRRTLGAQIGRVMRNKDNPEPQPGKTPPGTENKILHASFRIGDTTVMASDGRCTGNARFEGFSLSITVQKESDADRFFRALAEDGKVHMPLTKTFFSPKFGMVADRFGVLWMLMVGG